MTSLPTIGTRVRLTCDVDRFPHFIAPMGAGGVVVESTEHIFAVRLDIPLEGAEDWDNEVCWDLAFEGQDNPAAEVAEESSLAYIATLGNGPVKKFLLIKHFGPDLARLLAVSPLKLREHGCDELIGWLCDAINHRGTGGHPMAAPDNLRFFGEDYVRECLQA